MTSLQWCHDDDTLGGLLFALEVTLPFVFAAVRTDYYIEKNKLL